VLAGITAAIIIAVAGVAGGYFLFKAGWKPSAPAPATENDAADQNTEKRAPNLTVYDASPPSRGAVLKTVSVNVTRQENGRFLGGMIPMSQAGDIAKGQRVLLYGSNGALADIGATVSSIAPEHSDGHYASVILLADEEPSPQRAGDDSGLNDAERAEIILQRETGAQRLPLSAIVKKNGEPYLWEAVKASNGTRKVYLKRTNVLMNNAGMVVIDTPSSVSNVFVLNPDADLRDGDTVNIRDIYYEGPGQTDDQRLEEAMRARTPSYIVDTYKGPDIEFTCSAELAAQQSPANAVDAFIAQVRTLASQQEARKTEQLSPPEPAAPAPAEPDSAAVEGSPFGTAPIAQ
ncbi:MAG: hypothetical protein DI626_09665, partial [Micavibrio aeruginosavorus]